ncbi:MAG TPA: crotonase/enoyl-CoA hydratase family protein [Solirubrobacterales bacterium]|nr:crotonase/enoyl-CoA hydratase family protein [Solirubrobacterales bacterium]
METLQYEVREGVAWLTLDDGRANALNLDVIAALETALANAENDEAVRAVVLAGRTGFFSAGLDLNWLPTLSREELASVGRAIAEISRRIFIFPKPMIAAVTGHAVAGGAVLLLACDRSVGAEGNFKIGLNEVAIGMPMGGFGLDLAAAHLSPAALSAGLLYGEMFDPVRARELGYLDELVAPGKVIERAGEIALKATEISPFAYVATKHALRDAAALKIAEQIESGALDAVFQMVVDAQAARESTS